MLQDLEKKKKRIADRLLELGYRIETQKDDFVHLARMLKELDEALLELDDLIREVKAHDGKSASDKGQGI